LIKPFLNALLQSRSRALGAFHPGFHLVSHVESGILKLIEHNGDAYKLCTGRLYISVSSIARLRSRNFLISSFSSNEHLATTIANSCEIPGFSGPAWSPRRYHVDGGFTNNFPIPQNGLPTVVVSPFAGSCDISPGTAEPTQFISIYY